MGDAFKTNTTLTELNLEGGDKRIHTHDINRHYTFFHFHPKSTGNYIGETGATSMSEALKSNTTLTELNLRSEHKRNNT